MWTDAEHTGLHTMLSDSLPAEDCRSSRNVGEPLMSQKQGTSSCTLNVLLCCCRGKPYVYARPDLPTSLNKTNIRAGNCIVHTIDRVSCLCSAHTVLHTAASCYRAWVATDVQSNRSICRIATGPTCNPALSTCFCVCLPQHTCPVLHCFVVSTLLYITTSLTILCHCVLPAATVLLCAACWAALYCLVPPCTALYCPLSRP
jgi:hypothetical protein